jgi:5-methylcytosine-specific restriction endonuclease McrA
VPIAEQIREMAEQYSGAFKYIFKNNTKYVMDEQILVLACYYANDYSHGISKNILDSAYEDNSDVWKRFSTGGGKKLIEKTLTIISKHADAGFKQKSTLLNFFMVMKRLQKEERQVIDQKSLLKWFMATENARLGSKEPTYIKDADSKSYATCCRTMAKDLIEARYHAISKDLLAIPDNIVTELDPERLFTATQRYQMWINQEGICPRTGKTIPEDEINNHELWAADHVIPYAKGGETTLNNGELVCKKYNLSKGAKMPESVETL